jgi:hypothetical protein
MLRAIAIAFFVMIAAVSQCNVSVLSPPPERPKPGVVKRILDWFKSSPSASSGDVTVNLRAPVAPTSDVETKPAAVDGLVYDPSRPVRFFYGPKPADVPGHVWRPQDYRLNSWVLYKLTPKPFQGAGDWWYRDTDRGREVYTSWGWQPGSSPPAQQATRGMSSSGFQDGYCGRRPLFGGS